MSSQATNTRGRPLPKFGEWDVNNPASAEGFTVIFNKARDQKKTNGTAVGGGMSSANPQRFENEHNNNGDNQHKRDHNKQKQDHHQMQKKWLCCFIGS